MSDFKRCDHCLNFFPTARKEVCVLQIREGKSLNVKVFASFDICPRCRNYILGQLKPTTEKVPHTVR